MLPTSVLIPRNPERYYRIDPDSGCWIWIRSIDRDGYGLSKLRGKNMRAHRLIWILERGEIPDGMTLDHLCENRACVNPAHLKLATLIENVFRTTNRKFMTETDLTIVRLLAPTHSDGEIGREIGFSAEAVRRARLGFSYQKRT